jgi:2-keto-4-pentenoate hydratase/2-oxohepta-3-ene-1,7-dioic acid hydratase in catechol pathway
LSNKIGTLLCVINEPIDQYMYCAEIEIGHTAKDVTEEESKDYILGYTCFNDVSERMMQAADVQLGRAKGFDTFAPLGPRIATGIDGDNLKIEALVNGKVKQSSNTNLLIFGVSFLLSFISHIKTLLPGDIIATGTPEGVSPLNHGDIVDVRIEGIGTLMNYVIKRKLFKN